MLDPARRETSSTKLGRFAAACHSAALRSNVEYGAFRYASETMQQHPIRLVVSLLHPAVNVVAALDLPLMDLRNVAELFASGAIQCAHSRPLLA